MQPHHLSSRRSLSRLLSAPGALLLAALMFWLLTGSTVNRTVRLFDGTSFSGWEGNLSVFRIEDGSIIGGSLKAPVARNEFLCTTRDFTDFVLRLKFRVLGKGAKSE
jgi:hypothetical protein